MAARVAASPAEAGAAPTGGRKGLMPFIVISISYLLFTITDGGVRMIVLLHAYSKGFTAMVGAAACRARPRALSVSRAFAPVSAPRDASSHYACAYRTRSPAQEVAIMFTLYELAGVVTNIAAGMLGDRWGIRWTLNVGLSLQIGGLAMLFGWQEDWPKSTAIVFVTLAQMLCGIAKDLTKLGGKTVTKIVTPEAQQSKLFKLVSLLTGWKNALKGVGYFIGAALLDSSEQYGYYIALSVMVALVLLAFPWAVFGLDSSLGTAKKKPAELRQILCNPNYNLNMLSCAHRRCAWRGSARLGTGAIAPPSLPLTPHLLGARPPS
jgi:MFS family permease